MADDGRYEGSVVIKLDKCSSLIGFDEPSTFEGLNAHYECKKQVPTAENTENKNPACFEIINSCTQQLRMLILRPLSALWELPKKNVGDPVVREWREIDKETLPRDLLATLLTFQKDGKDATPYALGRAQIYYDGMLRFLVDPATAGCSKFELKLGSHKDNSLGQLWAVTVQIITAYGPLPAVTKESIAPDSTAGEPRPDCDDEKPD